MDRASARRASESVIREWERTHPRFLGETGLAYYFRGLCWVLDTPEGRQALKMAAESQTDGQMANHRNVSYEALLTKVDETPVNLHLRNKRDIIRLARRRALEKGARTRVSVWHVTSQGTSSNAILIHQGHVEEQRKPGRLNATRLVYRVDEL